MPWGKVKIRNTASLRHRLVDATGSPALADGFNESRHDCVDAKSSFFPVLGAGDARANFTSAYVGSRLHFRKWS